MKRFYLILLMLLLGLFGCAREKPVEKETIIRFFNPQGLSEEIAIMKEIVNKFEEDNPDIKVKIDSGGTPDKILVEIAGGSPPDVFLTWMEKAPLAEKNALMVLDDYVKKYNVNLSDYFPWALDFSKYKGKLYCLPVNMHISVVFYNKDMLKKAGIPYPEASWTWEDFHKIAKGLTMDTDNDGRRDQFGVQLASLNPWLLPNHGHIVDMENKKVNVKSKEVIESLKFAYRLYQDACPTLSQMKTFGGVGEVDPFMSGKVGMLVQTAAYASIFSQIKNFNWDIAPLPVPPGGRRVNVISGDWLAIPAGTKHPDEAFRFVKYYCGKEGMKILSEHKRLVLPFKEAALGSLVPPPENITYLSNIFNEPYTFDLFHGQGDTRWSQVVDVSYRWWELILLGNVGFDEGINKMEEEMNRKLKQILGSVE